MKNILIPTDLTESATNTLKYAIQLGHKSDSKMFFYHQGNDEAKNDPYFGDFIKSLYEELKIKFDSSQNHLIFERGEFSNEHIKKIIQKHKVKFVIMGASHEGFEKTFFGSYVSELINELSCSVLAIPHGHTDFKMERIAFASELFDLSTRLGYIIDFAKLFHAHIEVFHVYPVYPSHVDMKKFDPNKVLEKLKTQFEYDPISLHLIQTSYDNEIITGIKKYLNSNHPDLLVMFHKPRGWFDKLAFDEGTTPSMIKSSPVPILALNKKSTIKIS